MMILLGQHGQRQDYQMGLNYISLAAQSCDENAPQGAYVSETAAPSSCVQTSNMACRFTVCSWHGSYPR